MSIANSTIISPFQTTYCMIWKKTRTPQTKTEQQKNTLLICADTMDVHAMSWPNNSVLIITICTKSG